MALQSPHARIRAAREAWGLSTAEVAGRTGLALPDYADLEETPGALREAIDLRHLKRVCEVLELDLFALLDLLCGYCGGEGAPVHDQARPPRHERVRARREALGLPAETLAARVGVRVEAIDAMTRDPNFLDTWPVAFVEDLARLLETPAQSLLDAVCPRCWR